MKPIVFCEDDLCGNVCQSQLDEKEFSRTSLVSRITMPETQKRVMLDSLIQKNHEWALRVAIWQLRKWGVRNVENEAADVVQQTYVELLSNSERFDPKREYRGWVYRIIYRSCIPALKRQLNNLFRATYDDPADDRENWMEAFISTEQVQELSKEVGNLRRTLRSAVEKWLEHRGVGKAMKFVSERAQRRFNNRMYLARKAIEMKLSVDDGIKPKKRKKNK